MILQLLRAVLLLAGCTPAPEPLAPGLSVPQIEARIRSDVKTDRTGWATDVRDALVSARRSPDADAVCQVLAIVEQESTYRADPAVPGLGKIARSEIEAKLSLLGPLSDLGIDWLLSPVPEGATQSFSDRLDAVKTERDLDRLFRDLVAYHQGRVPGLQEASATLLAGRIERLNPVTTAGSMQVSVSFAQEMGTREGVPPETVRELLYTRTGGLHYGVARLFAHDAEYDKAIYRFADYNAGLYASRNAAFQTQLAELMGVELAPDGDLMAWTDAGRPSHTDSHTLGTLLAWRAVHAPDLEERQLRRDVRLEKTHELESTETWRRIRAAWKEKTGKEPAYARLPDVTLQSPKITKQRTTAWFAQSVDRRYQDCLKRGK
ncbi:MAG: DUF1615 family protein [Myxococcota bacterium]